MSAVDSTLQVTTLLESWDAEFSSATSELVTLLAKNIDYQGTELNLVGLLRRLAEIVEHETEEWYKSDPDPFDDRHPGRADPNCALGHVMKILFKNDTFMSKLVNSYLTGRDHTLDELHIIASRLLLDIMPGLETTVIFQDNESLVRNLIEWSQSASEPLCSYSTGLLACAMEIQEVASAFKESNSVLVPHMLRRLQALKEETQKENLANYANKNSAGKRHFKDVGKETEHRRSSGKHSATPKSRVPATSDPTTSSTPTSSAPINPGGSKQRSKRKKMANGKSDDEEVAGISDSANVARRHAKRMRTSSPNNTTGASVNNLSGFFPPDDDQQLAVVVEDKKIQSRVSNTSHFDDTGNSNSCWAELEPLVICKFCMWPLSIEMRQRLILTYLQPMGEYQELLMHVFELPVLDLLFYYIDLKQNKDVRLAFEALKYMAALLCHKKFAVEFISAGGIQKLLAVERPSVAATGVSMCLYYLAYFDDPMERVCLLPQSTLVDMVSFALWLLKCKHESGRVHATMFFGLSFLYRVMVDLFDQKGGLRMLFNVVSTLRILNVTDALSDLTDDELFTNRQSARHVTVAIRRYLEAHLAIKSDQIRKSNMRSEGEVQFAEAPANKASKFSPEMIQENVEVLLEFLPPKAEWKPVNDLIKLGAIQTLMHLLYISEDWANYSGKVETLRSALDVLSICCVIPRAKNMLCDSIKLPDNSTIPAVSILLSLASGQNVAEPEVQKAALNVIINSVCGPITKLNGAKVMNNSSRRRNSIATNEEPLTRMWAAVRNNNGIMVLLTLLNIKLPVTEADSIRTLACKALVGLSRCSTVKQIISKLPMFSNGQLQQLMWEPVLQDKRLEHAKFFRYAVQLIEQVSGKPSRGTEDPSLDRMRRADIVAKTNIIFNSRELLQLIHDHLLKEGLHETAGALEKEANLQLHPTPSAMAALPQVSLTPKVCKPANGEPSFLVPPTPLSFSTPKPPMAEFAAPAGHAEVVTPGRRADISVISVTPQEFPKAAPLVVQSKPASVVPSSVPNANNSAVSVTNQSATVSSLLSSTPLPCRGAVERRDFVTPSNPIGSGSKISLRRSLHTPNASTNQLKLKQLQNSRYESTPSLLQSTTPLTPAANQLSILSSLSNQKGSIAFGTGTRNNIKANRMALQAPTPALSAIVTSYLQHQHANCRNPVVTCPPFSLLKPHRCPEPKNRRSAPSCVTSRHFARQTLPPYGGFEGIKFDRKYVFSRFRPFRTYRDSDSGIFSCCAFTADQRSLLLGTCTGDLKMFNIMTSEETFLNQCHEAPITHCEPSRDGSLVLTSSNWGSSMSALWRMIGSFDVMHSFNEDEHVEFSKQTQDKIVGTKEGTANIYDVNTGTKLYSLFDSERCNNYSRNRATFGPTDELLLNDGVLWDLESRRPIHKFDKFNSNVSGVFHPNGTEVIINSQVWDVRTYHLLYTVETLDQCQIRFNETGKILYGAIHQMDEDDLLDDSRTRNSFNSSFRTLDGTDYSSIATVDVKRAIHDLCTDVNDTYLAVVENYRQSDTLSEESVCRLYEIGRLKDSEDDQVDDDEDNQDDNDDDDDEDDDDDTVTVAFDNDRNVRLGDVEPDDLLNDMTSGSESEFDIDLGLIDDDEGDEDDDDDIEMDDEDDDEEEENSSSGVASRLRSRSRRRHGDEDDDDDDLDNVLFELSDMSNF